MLLGVIIVARPILLYDAFGLDGRTIIVVWLAGAGALGLLSGYTTGASEQTGTAGEFLKFLSGGVLVPLVGGIAALVRQPERTTERSTYVGDHVTEKITEVTLPSQAAHFHPLLVLGSFFVAYSVLAIIGIRLGVAHRAGGISIKMK